jgi:hypothetical protein
MGRFHRLSRPAVNFRTNLEKSACYTGYGGVKIKPKCDLFRNEIATPEVVVGVASHIGKVKHSGSQR